MNQDAEYLEMKRRIDASIRKEEVRARILAAKRAEKRAIKKAGGGVAIARAILQSDTNYRDDDTNFNFGHNQYVDSSQHSSEDNESDVGCMGQVSCKKCGKFHGYCREVAEEKEKSKMLPSGDGRTTTTTARKGGMNYIKIEHLSTQPQEAKILMVRYNEQGRFGSRVEMKCAFNGEIAYLSVVPSKSDPRYKILIDNFGQDENNWVNQRILLHLEQNEFTEQYQMRVTVPDKKGKK